MTDDSSVGIQIRRPFGATGLRFFPLGLGTASLAGVNMVGAPDYARLTDESLAALLTAAIDALAGNDRVMLDTSAQYGESERRIGAFLAAHPGARERLYLATKWGLVFDPADYGRQDYTRENLLRSVEASAGHLGRIDLLYLHTNPRVPPALLEGLLRGRDGVVDLMRSLKHDRRAGIAYLGVSLSTPENLRLLVARPELLRDFDALQLNASLLVECPDLAAGLRRSPLGIVLNSLYRKGDPALRGTPDGRRALHHRALAAHPDALILTGTRTPLHLRENIEHVATWLRPPGLALQYASPASPADVHDDVAAAFRRHFARLACPATTGSPPRGGSEPCPPTGVAIDQATAAVTRVLLGSRKTRLGAVPPPRSQEVLRERVHHKIRRGLPIEAILTWGPRKFYAQGHDNVSDVAEAVALERLVDLHHLVAAVYPPGLHVTVFAEDYEGQFIERVPLVSFAPYIESLAALVRVAGIDDTITVVRTSALLGRSPPRLGEAAARLETNYAALQAYWRQSETAAGGPGERDSLQVLEDLGFAGPITGEARQFYLARLHRLLGDRLAAEERVEMVLRLFACILMHRQLDLFRIDADLEPVKLSFLPVVGGPQRLRDGRIDLRVVSTDVSRRSIAPWSAKGYLRPENGRLAPALKPWREPLPGSTRLLHGELRLRRAGDTAVIRADLLESP